MLELFLWRIKKWNNRQLNKIRGTKCIEITQINETLVRRFVLHTMEENQLPAVTERFIRTLKNKTYKYMTAISKSVYMNKIAEIVKEYDNTINRESEWSQLMLKQKHW